MKQIIDNSIIIGTIITAIVFIFFLVYWYIKDLKNSIQSIENDLGNKIEKQRQLLNKQFVINKYITIMILRFENQYPNHSCSVFTHDIDNLFSEEELSYILSYLKDKERLKIIMKGKNEIHGQEL